MSEATPHDRFSSSRPRFEPSPRSKWLAFGVVVVAGFAAILVFWWRPWAAGPCVDDGSHVVDDESGVCYSIPEGWQEDLTADNPLTSVISAEGAVVAVGPLEDSTAEAGVEQAASNMAASTVDLLPGVYPPLEERTGTVDGHASATVVQANKGTWAMVTTIELEDRMVVVVGSCPEDESGLIAQIEEVHDSLRIE